MQSFENPYEACKEAHAIAVLTEWDEFVSMIGSAYDSMQKPAFVLMEEIY
jgi:UDPglucose 6-dehydrogenase